ncbi:Putative ERCC1/RAD10/SWI10 family, RuvA domain 2, restriction endonuclease type II [Septoria linicola]|uniref:ERCC1/RAD10/SWI10 family, RuvA domain 2, restriction endonuclease type II n=1 Tax=Septoria linicola TaxID=215465 RepID=A0A9Q9EEU5_9PEZI|nr:putative ERCC1/RAD10/SWI10 family, RuvA domain 2, restriction endonuclease type II [Septoria linicola]USW46892.1 Putative ERCC1/RAD10/SWI10 family, RuvA domain 2, restriction endonuclease type II [Septoria linicola]
MADEIEDDGPHRAGPNVSRNATTGSNPSHASGSRQSGQPFRQPGLDRQNGAPSTTKTGVQQPKPQALPRRSGPASIIVSPRQKGNPILDKIKSLPWEYGDIPADYVLGVTTCALFLSLKYHRLHPEYIYTRIKNLQGKYALRVVLCMVDIQNHEESLKELSKTSLINNVTIILCWSAAEGARYLELLKTYENAAPTSIKQHQSNSYSDRMVDFVTTPRSINKTDAVSLVSQFGTVRTAVNARHEEVAMIGGWGEKKVQQWVTSVSEPFRIQRAGKRSLQLENMVSSQPVSRAPTLSRDVTREDSTGSAIPTPALSRANTGLADADRRPGSRLAEQVDMSADDDEAFAEAMNAAMLPEKRNTAPPRQEPTTEVPKKRKQDDASLSEGVMAALNKLRKPG